MSLPFPKLDDAVALAQHRCREHDLHFEDQHDQLFPFYRASLR